MTRRRDFGGRGKKTLVGLNVLLKLSLEFLCFPSVAKSIPSVFMFLFCFLFTPLSSGLLRRRFKDLYLVCE